VYLLNKAKNLLGRSNFNKCTKAEMYRSSPREGQPDINCRAVELPHFSETGANNIKKKKICFLKTIVF